MAKPLVVVLSFIGLNVYSDDYFPYSQSSMVEWSVRGKKQKRFLNCMNDHKNLNKCKDDLLKLQNIIILSERQLNSNSKLLFTKGEIEIFSTEIN